MIFVMDLETYTIDKVLKLVEQALHDRTFEIFWSDGLYRRELYFLGTNGDLQIVITSKTIDIIHTNSVDKNVISRDIYGSEITSEINNDIIKVLNCIVG